MPQRNSCSLCGNGTELVLKLNPMPLTDDFDNGPDTEFYPTELFGCKNCGHVQLGFVVDAGVMFNSNYAYRSGFSPGLKKHFDELAIRLQQEIKLDSKSFVIDIGCNDGTLLFALENSTGCKIYGIDPAASEDVPGTKSLLDDEVANYVVTAYGKADLITASNVLAHVEDPIKFLNTARKLMKSEGIFCCEVGNLNTVINNLVWETIYHEHLNYFKIDALFWMFKQTGFRPVCLEYINTHGGSVRIICKLASRAFRKNKPVIEIQNLDFLKKNIEDRKNKILEFCNGDDGIVAIGASAKASVILHQTGLWPRAVVDDNPYKQNKRMPGTNIPIVGREVLKDLDEKVLVLAWNEIEAIRKSMPEFAGRMIVAAPQPYII